MNEEQDLFNDVPVPVEFDALNFMDKQFETSETAQSGLVAVKSRHKEMRIHLKAMKKNKVKTEHLKKLLPNLPEQGWSYHVISSGNFDFWTYVPHIVKLAGKFKEFYCSTWTMNRQIAIEMLDLYDTGQLGSISLLTGKYFKRRETAVYALIAEGLLARSQRYIAFGNHAKIILLGNDDCKLVIEGSANLTANPRTEQFILTNNSVLYDFHKKWMDEMYEKKR